MRRIIGLAGALLGSALLAACGTQLQTAKNTQPAGSDFHNALYGEYIELAKFEYDEADYRDSDFYAVRAITVARGEDVEPTPLEARELPPEAVEALTAARQRLVAALAAGAHQHHPQPAARAVAMFDCWMEQQEENSQPAHIAYCREEFEVAVAKLTPVEKKPALDAQTYRIYFGLGSAALSADADRIVQDAAASYREKGYGSVSLYGYTDTSGSEEANAKLAARRAEAVREALIRAGVPDGNIRITVRGEYNLPKPTADGVQEPANRLVIIRLAE